MMFYCAALREVRPSTMLPFGYLLDQENAQHLHPVSPL